MIVKSTDAAPKQFKGVPFDVLAVGEQMMVTRMYYQAGDHVPPHEHANEQAGYVVSGRYRVRFGDYDEVLRAGDTYGIPMDVQHTIDALEAGDIIDIFSPPREDYMA